jgi:hypothetical protein
MASWSHPVRIDTKEVAIMTQHTLSSTARGRERNALDIARDAFNLLVTGPEPLAVNGRRIRGLPRRRIPLDELRDRLLSRRYRPAVRDAVWAYLVRRARAEGGAWTVGCVGVALPALTAVAAKLTRCFAGDPTDIHADVLSGFLAGLATIDTDQPKIMLRLRWRAYRSGHAALLEALGGPTRTASGFRSQLPTRPWGHPDLVLARAVAERVLTPTEAELIGSTRLEEISIRDWATARGVDYFTAYRVRARAEDRLIAHLRDGAHDADADDTLIAQVTTALTLRDAATLVLRMTSTPTRSLSVSGRLRNGWAHISEKAGRAVFKNAPKSGVQGRGGTTSSPQPPAPPAAGPAEEPPCA